MESIHALDRVIVLAVVFFACAFQPLATADTVIIGGTMQTSGTFVRHDTIATPKGMNQVVVNFAEPVTRTEPGQTAAVEKFSIATVPPPASKTETTDSNGNHYVSLTYNRPIPSVISYDATYEGTSITVDLSKSIPANMLPLSNVPTDVAPYLKATDLVQVDDAQIQATASSVTGKCATEARAAEAISAYLQTMLSGAATRQGAFAEDASSVLSEKTGGQTGWAHLFLALARASGIPARIVSGIAIAGKLDIPASPDSADVIQETYPGSPTIWVQIWYPGTGWIDYNPGQTCGFVDCVFVTEGYGKDYGDFMPATTWQADHLVAPQIAQTDAFDISGLKTKVRLMCTGKVPDQTIAFLMSRRMDRPSK